ncbi:MAG: MOFRL family protein, partial [Gemmatimonadaceae bacterium]
GRTDVALLAAGTDGRDGPTDAAGALVDATTWETIRLRGPDPERALRTHDSYPALEAAGALLRTGLTGTNVMDVVIGVRG